MSSEQRVLSSSVLVTHAPPLTPHTLPPRPLPRTCQVVAKSCKMVPVMLMGYVVSGRRYTCLEYAMAASP